MLRVATLKACLCAQSGLDEVGASVLVGDKTCCQEHPGVTMKGGNPCCGNQEAHVPLLLEVGFYLVWSGVVSWALCVSDFPCSSSVRVSSADAV